MLNQTFKLNFSFIAVLASILVASNSLAAAVNISSNETVKDVGLFSRVFKDVAGNLTIDDIREPAQLAEFQSSQQETLNFGLGLSEAYWVTFSSKTRAPLLFVNYCKSVIRF